MAICPLPQQPQLANLDLCQRALAQLSPHGLVIWTPGKEGLVTHRQLIPSPSGRDLPIPCPHSLPYSTAPPVQDFAYPMATGTSRKALAFLLALLGLVLLQSTLATVGAGKTVLSVQPLNRIGLKDRIHGIRMASRSSMTQITVLLPSSCSNVI